MKKHYVFIALYITFLLTSPTTAVSAEQEMLVLLNSNNYCAKVREALQKANKSIDVAMYIMVLEEKGNRFRGLIDELVAAHGRGVVVNVILDKRSEILDEEQKGELSDYYSSDNSKACDYLKSRGINVKYDLSDRVMHASLIAIDEKIVISSSMYWAEPICCAFELGIITESEKLAQDALLFLEGIETE